jgi:hypothetical protein
VSKAIRRLEQLARWGYERRETLAEGGNITAAAVAQHMSLWGIVVSQQPAASSSCHPGAVVLAIDMAAMDLEALAASSAAETQRLFFYLVHALGLDDAVQQHGIVFVEDFAGVKFSSAKLFLKNPAIEDALRVLQGASAVRIKHFYFVHQPWWMAALTAIMKVVLSKKLRARISTHHGWNTVVKLLGTSDALPENLFVASAASGSPVDRVFGRQLVNVPGGFKASPTYTSNAHGEDGVWLAGSSSHNTSPMESLCDGANAPTKLAGGSSHNTSPMKSLCDGANAPTKLAGGSSRNTSPRESLCDGANAPTNGARGGTTSRPRAVVPNNNTTLRLVLSKNAAGSLGLTLATTPDGVGAWVSAVRDGPNKRCGVQVGDAILAIGDEDVTVLPHVSIVSRIAKAPQAVSLTVGRGGKRSPEGTFF